METHTIHISMAFRSSYLTTREHIKSNFCYYILSKFTQLVLHLCTLNNLLYLHLSQIRTQNKIYIFFEQDSFRNRALDGFCYHALTLTRLVPFSWRPLLSPSVALFWVLVNNNKLLSDYIWFLTRELVRWCDSWHIC